MENLHSTKKLFKRTLKQLFNATEKLIKDQNEIQGYIRDQLAATNLAEDKLCFLTRQFSYQMQKPTYSPTQYCVWEGSVKIPAKLGRRRSTGFRIHFNMESWMESMGSRGVVEFPIP